MFFSYTKKNVVCISLLISIFIFFIANYTFIKFQNFTYKDNENKLVNENLEESISKWNIEIPKINLKARIEEGTSSDVMEKYVAHFEETSIWKGNVGLTAYSSNYTNNYFEGLKELTLNDEIIYTLLGEQKHYKITNIEIIHESDWSYLKKTKKDTITLITGIEEEPEYRLCVQGVSINF